MSTTIHIGTAAPDFTLPMTEGGSVTLSKLRPSRVVLYFYPRNDTTGCTNQALDFSAHLKDFHAAGCQVIGISKDALTKHEKFAAKYNLSVPLASDMDADTCETYGVWVQKKMYGRTFWGIERSTFLIGADGTIEKIWRKVKVPCHVDDVLNVVTNT